MVISTNNDVINDRYTINSFYYETNSKSITNWYTHITNIGIYSTIMKWDHCSWLDSQTMMIMGEKENISKCIKFESVQWKR